MNFMGTSATGVEYEYEVARATVFRQYESFSLRTEVSVEDGHISCFPEIPDMLNAKDARLLACLLHEAADELDKQEKLR